MIATKTVSVIGTGAMGSALARAFLANNHTLTVWNRTASKCVPLEQAGAKVAGSVAEAAQASDLIVVNVLNYSVSKALLQTQDVVNQLKGKVVVQLTTGIPSEAREMEDWAKQNGLSYLDGAILDYPKGIGTKESMILYAGPEAVFEANKSLLLSLGGEAKFVGKAIGSASALDSSVLSVYYGVSLSFLHGVGICESEGISIEQFLSVIVPILSGPIVDTIEICEKMINKGDYTGSEASMTVHKGAIQHILSVSQEKGINTSYPECLLDYCKRGIAAAGHEQYEFPSVIEIIRKNQANSL
ncbi:MAG TPA: NAD(P)-dependent oxidoreductase [Thiotrichaceae bacterium]|nr:NAD(P)-dependent oxidoreductase [Thiotrichaceae bacterium]